MTRSSLLVILVLTASCASLLPRDLPDEPPPLADMVEPLHLFQEPDDEAARTALPAGSFTGIEAGSARRSLDETEEPPGVVVRSVAENSPADAAGLSVDDLLLSAAGPAGTVELVWPSQWRKLEIDAAPGTRFTIRYDRAGVPGETELTTIARVRPPGRVEAERYRENKRVGVVLRTATEVEARGAGLGPGAGAVVVGLSAGSPWRDAGIRFEDLLVEVNGEPVDHPQVVLDAIREGEEELRIVLLRGAERIAMAVPLSRRQQEVKHIGVPPLFDYEKDRDEVELEILLGLVRHRSTAAAWDWRFLWLFHVSGGDADELKEVER